MKVEERKGVIIRVCAAVTVIVGLNKIKSQRKCEILETFAF